MCGLTASTEGRGSWFSPGDPFFATDCLASLRVIETELGPTAFALVLAKVLTTFNRTVLGLNILQSTWRTFVVAVFVVAAAFVAKMFDPVTRRPDISMDIVTKAVVAFFVKASMGATVVVYAHRNVLKASLTVNMR